MNSFDNQSGPQSSDDMPLPLDLSQPAPQANAQQSFLHRTDDIPVEVSPLGPSQAPDEIPIALDPIAPLPGQGIGSTSVSNARMIITMNRVSTNNALLDVSLELFGSHIVCLICGSHEKAHQLLHVLALEEVVTAGQLLIWNQDVLQLDETAREKFRHEHILYVRRSQLENSNQSTRRHMAYWLHYYGEFKWTDAQEAARRALHSIKLPPNRWDIPTQDLSNEEIARVTIAKIHSVSSHKSIYLLDDIFADLDRFSSAIVGDLFQRLRTIANQGKVVVIHTERHDLSAYFDRILSL